MPLYNFGTNTLIPNPSDAQLQMGVDFRNAAATARPDLYGDATYTLSQAKADIAGQFVGFYAPSGTLRGYIIVSQCEYGDPDINGRSQALKVGDLVIDPSLFNSTTVRTVINLIKTWAQRFLPALTRLVGEVNDDSPFWNYAQTTGWRLITSCPDPTVANPNRKLMMIDRFIVGTNG